MKRRLYSSGDKERRVARAVTNHPGLAFVGIAFGLALGLGWDALCRKEGTELPRDSYGALRASAVHDIDGEAAAKG